MTMLPKPWARDLDANRYYRDTWPQPWAQRVIPSPGDNAEYYNTSPWSPVDPRILDVPGGPTIDANRLSGVLGENTRQPTVPTLSEHLQRQYRQEFAPRKSPFIMDYGPAGPYPYNPHTSEAQRLAREEELRRQLEQFPGTPNFRALPQPSPDLQQFNGPKQPWEPEVLPFD